MQDNILIDFNKFYLLEFFNNVKILSEKYLSNTDFRLINNLMDYLEAQKDMTEGLETLAREQGTSELSIFLFDFIERMADYPPTLVYDSLLEMAEDFVNTARVMMEEGESRSAIEKVNMILSGEPVVEEPEEVAEQKIETAKEEELKPEEVTEQKSEAAKEEELEPEPETETTLESEIAIEAQEEFSYFEYVNSEFAFVYNSYEKKIPLNYVDLLKDTCTDLPHSQNLPVEMARLFYAIECIFPWQYDMPYSIQSHGSKIERLIKDFFDHLDAFIETNKQIVKESIAKNQIQFPSASGKLPLKKEEIPEKPVTIDALLSEYFQSDADDYIEKFKKALANLEADPTESSRVNELLELLKAFKEICMIHGYVHLEDLSTDIAAVVKEQQRKRKYLSSRSLSLLAGLIELFKNTDKLRSDIDETAERAQLNIFLTDFAQSFEKKKKETSEKLSPEKKIEQSGIHFNQKEKLSDIIRDIIQETSKQIISNIKKKEFDKAKVVVRNFIGAAKLTMLIPVFDLCTTIIEAIEICESTNDKVQKEKLAIFCELYQQFTLQYTTDDVIAEWQSKWSEFCAATDHKEEILIPLSDRERLLEIILEIEEVNLPGFNQRLHSVCIQGDTDSKKAMSAHFRRLSRNAEIIGLDNLKKLSNHFVDICSQNKTDETDKNKIDTLGNLYIACIQRFKERGTNTDIVDLISGFESPGAVKSQIHDDSDEELLVIFKEEGDNYLNIIEKALDDLANDYKDRKQYEIIEKNIHSLKSSARLMGFTDVVEMSIPLEAKCEKFNENNLVADKDSLPVFRELVAAIRELIAGNDIDVASLKEKFGDIRGIEVETDDSELIVEALDKSPQDKIEDEKPLFTEAGDEDAEMLKIFKEEASEYIKTIEEANTDLKKDPDNKEALHKQEYASHSLKSAAMMLGFREIGQIADSIEQVTESVNKSELKNNPEIIEQINHAIELVKELTEGKTVVPDKIADCLNALELNQLKQQYSSEESSGDQDDTVEIGSMGELFLKEAWEFIDKINRGLVNLEKDPGNLTLIDDINRNVHTLKGSAQMMHFEKIGQLAHGMEDYLEQLKENPDKKFDPVFEGLDEIQQLMHNIKSGKGEESKNYKKVLENLSDLENQSAPNSVVRSGNDLRQEDTEKNDDFSVRIRTGRLDSMINMAADLIVNKTKLSSHLDELKQISEQIEKDRKVLKTVPKSLADGSEDDTIDNKEVLQNRVKTLEADYNTILQTYDAVTSKFSQLMQNVEESLSQISLLTKNLHDDILQTRMVPVETLFNRFPRAVRDIAHKQNKKITLVVEGEDTELDRVLVENLSDPVMHLLRNAIDHGIELPEERIKNKKNEEGVLLLRARQERNQVLIEVQDDGRGLNMDKIKETIIARKLATPVEISEKSVNELISYIFTPGFSTTGNVSDLSGRGIGLDAVFSEVRKLKGDLRVNFTPGKGTTFSIRVPLSLLILQALLIELGDETFALPLASVTESLLCDQNKIKEDANELYYKINKENLKILDLAHLMNLEKTEENKQNIVVLDEAGLKFGILVDRVVGRQDIVVKSIGEQLKQVPYISGGTILGDGSVCLILDILALCREIETDRHGVSKDIPSTEKAKKLVDTSEDQISPTDAKKEKKKALIVDDSISVRKFLSTVLTRNKFDTILASNGAEALDELNKGSFDLVLTDLEMPRLDGFEFIKQLRNIDRYKDIPVIILSGRASNKHQEQGKKLGANAFIVKPFKESDLVEKIKEFLN